MLLNRFDPSRGTGTTRRPLPSRRTVSQRDRFLAEALHQADRRHVPSLLVLGLLGHRVARNIETFDDRIRYQPGLQVPRGDTQIKPRLDSHVAVRAAAPSKLCSWPTRKTHALYRAAQLYALNVFKWLKGQSSQSALRGAAI